MKCRLINCFLLYVAFSSGTFTLVGQSKDVNYEFGSSVGFSSETTLPFWLVSNRYGSVPDSDHLLLSTGIYSDFNRPDGFFDFSYKARVTGFLANENNVSINELHLSFRLGGFILDLGSKDDDVVWNNLSSSNGNIVKSINARAMPGINIKTDDFILLPFAKKWLSIKGNFAHYFLNDLRAVDDAYVHNKSLFFKAKVSPKFEIITGIDHYAQWGGTSEVWGDQPSGFSDLLRVVFGAEGDETATLPDQFNSLGSHYGAYLLQLNNYGEKIDLSFYYSHPIDDASGRELKNWVDGLYGLHVDFKKENAFVTQILGEFTYTKNMSGAKRDFVGDGLGARGSGRDNYFNNYLYSSGWTYFGRTVGSPYFTTNEVDENGITQGIIRGDNRFMAFNLATRGFVKTIEYKAMLSHTTYYGWFGEEYDPSPVQISGILELILPQSALNLPFQLSASMSFDTGTYRPVNFGGFISLSKAGIF